MLWLTGGSLSEDIARMLPEKDEEDCWNSFVIGRNLPRYHGFGLLLRQYVFHLFEGANNDGLGGIGELIWLILLGLGIISMVISTSFFKNMIENVENDVILNKRLLSESVTPEIGARFRRFFER